MRTEIVKLTPALAEHYLSKNTTNRNVSQRLVNKYAHDMESGGWMTNHQGIAFYEDGSVADGQHRLMAVVQSGKTVNMMATFGLKKPVAATIDGGRKRSMADGIRIGEMSDWIGPRHVYLINQIADSQSKRLSATETVDWLEGMKDSAQFAVEAFCNNKRALVNAVLHAAMALAHFYNPGREDDLLRFASTYMDGVALSNKDVAAIRLRDEFLTNTHNGASYRKDKFLKAQRAIQAFLKGDPIARLVRPKDDIWIYNREEKA